MQTIQQTTNGMDMLQLGDGPFIFSGKPPICGGSLVIGSTSNETVRVRALSTKHREYNKLVPLGFGQIKVQARLKPGSLGAVPAHFQIDPHTATGGLEVRLARDPPGGHARGRKIGNNAAVLENEQGTYLPRIHQIDGQETVVGGDV